MAAEAGLALAAKPDSQEICFIPGGDYSVFLRAYLEEQGEALPESAGELVTAGGEVVGRHAGIHGFTVGQRKGLNVTQRGAGDAAGVGNTAPRYVLAIHPDSHRVTVGADEELLSRELRARQLNWISVAGLAAGEEMRAQIKIRHRHEPAWATLRGAGSGMGADEVHATFDEPQRAITPGQAAVFYQGDEVVGGGWIV
jgi:tRNA-specific 2-thiouridylase